MYKALQDTAGLCGISRERIVSITASGLVNLGILAVFAGLASGAVSQVGEGPSLTVVDFGESGGGAARREQTAPPPPAPAPAGASAPQAARLVIVPEAERGVQKPVEVADSTVRPLTLMRQDLALPPAEPVQIAVAAPVPVRQAAEADPAAAEREGRESASESDGAQDAEGAKARPGGGSAAYAAAVRRHLMRYRRQNTVGAGSAYIHFTVRPDGRCHEVAVARTSGSSRFDRAAMQMVRRAVPFPRPPSGHSRTFNFEITGT